MKRKETWRVPGLRVIRLFSLFGLIFMLPVQAVEVSGLYEAEFEVTSQGRTERHKVIRDALVEVLIKVSGNGQVALSPGIPAILQRSLQFLQQYRYRTETLNSAEGDTAATRQLLWLRFDQAAVDQALRDINIAVWGRSRPTTLLWLAVEQGGQRQLLGGSEEASLIEAVTDQARRRGIPMVVPLLDLEDQLRLSAADVWANFQENILAASQRYAADAVLVGRLLDMGGGRWQGRWTLYLGGQQFNWSHTGLLEAALSNGIDGGAATLAARFVRPTEDRHPGELRILVKDIRSVADYARSNDYLRALDGVIDVQPSQVRGDEILFTVQVRGDQQSLVEAIRLSGKPVLAQLNAAAPVLPVVPGSLPAAPSADVTFRLIP